MNQATYASFLRRVKVAGEVIRSRQEEKEGLLNEFDAECKRFFFGKISERSLAATTVRVNKELARLNKEIRQAISSARMVSAKVTAFTAAQAPIGYRATLSGISGGVKKLVKRKAKKKTVKRKAKKRKPAKRKPAKRKTTKRRKR